MCQVADGVLHASLVQQCHTAAHVNAEPLVALVECVRLKCQFAVGFAGVSKDQIKVPSIRKPTWQCLYNRSL